MPHFCTTLENDLNALRNAGLYREMREIDSPQGREILLGGRRVLNFSSNDYLGLANSEELKEASVKAIKDFGAGAGASRLISGSLKPLHALEQALAQFKGTEAALVFATGYASALGTIPALVSKHDIVVIDKLVHASIVDGVRLAGATLRVFKHNDLNSLVDILQWVETKRQSETRVLIITESVFSMDGDLAPLREIVELKDQHGAWLMVDEAHATGLYGANRRGLVEELGLSDRVEIQMGTMGKALGAAGGFISGKRVLIDYLVNRARSLIFSTAPVPAAAAAAHAGVEIVMSDEGKTRTRDLWERVRLFDALRKGESATAPIIPLVIGRENDALSAAAALLEDGFFIPAIRYPTVARGKARLRLTLTADHTEADVRRVSEKTLPFAA